MVPLDAGSVDQILAVLNSPLANAWFDAHCRKRKVVQSILERLPFPYFTPGDVDQIRVLVGRLRQEVLAKWRSATEGLFYDGPPETLSSTDLRDEIDELVFRAYGLTSQQARHTFVSIWARKNDLANNSNAHDEHPNARPPITR